MKKLDRTFVMPLYSFMMHVTWIAVNLTRVILRSCVHILMRSQYLNTKLPKCPTVSVGSSLA